MFKILYFLKSISIKIVFPIGLEPITYCLEGNCSIQLNYRNMLKILLFRQDLNLRLQFTAGCSNQLNY